MNAVRPRWAAVYLATVVATAAAARAEDWEHRPELGGALDKETHLVWAPLASTWGGGFSGNVQSAEAACDQLAQLTQLPGWRLPTLPEAQTAIGHNAWTYFKAAWGEGNPASWTATSEGKKNWTVKYKNGAVGTLNAKNGLADFRAVREVPHWTYREDLGGWLDHHTGLVWGPTSTTWSGAGWSYDAAMLFGIPQYQQMTGNPKWRMPTLAEAQAAYAHNAIVYFNETWPNTGGGFLAWTADVDGKKRAWAFGMGPGNTMAVSKASSLWFRPVYRP